MEVYKAEDKDTKREVAWSTLTLTNIPKSKRDVLYDEIARLQKLSHDNLFAPLAAWTP